MEAAPTKIKGWIKYFTHMFVRKKQKVVPNSHVSLQQVHLQVLLPLYLLMIFICPLLLKRVLMLALNTPLLTMCAMTLVS